MCLYGFCVWRPICRHFSVCECVRVYHLHTHTRTLIHASAYGNRQTNSLLLLFSISTRSIIYESSTVLYRTSISKLLSEWKIPSTNDTKLFADCTQHPVVSIYRTVPIYFARCHIFKFSLETKKFQK